MPEYRRLTFEVILASKGDITAFEVAKQTGMAKKTAIHYLKELSILGVGELNQEAEPFRFYLSDELKGLLENRTHTPPELVTPSTSIESPFNELLSVQNHSIPGVTQNDGVCSFDGENEVELGGAIENF
jgi:hypothetical protein